MNGRLAAMAAGKVRQPEAAARKGAAPEFRQASRNLPVLRRRILYWICSMVFIIVLSAVRDLEFAW